MARPLAGRVAVVTGASRGAGRGIAGVLGEAGATVYVTGRSTRGNTTEGLSGSIDETAEEVTARGGRGIPVRCDHTVDEQVRALFERVKEEHGHLDILVNNVWGTCGADTRTSTEVAGATELLSAPRFGSNHSITGRRCSRPAFVRTSLPVGLQHPSW